MIPFSLWLLVGDTFACAHFTFYRYLSLCGMILILLSTFQHRREWSELASEDRIGCLVRPHIVQFHLAFYFPNNVFQRAEGFSFDEVQFINILFHSLCLSKAYLRNLRLSLGSKYFLPWFLSGIFVALGFTFRFMIHFK